MHAMPSGRLSRLRPMESDSLDEYGLPSRGDKSLLDDGKQEGFYTVIASRYLAFCTEAGDRDALQQKFAQLALESTSTRTRTRSAKVSTGTPPTPPLTGLPVDSTSSGGSGISSSTTKARPASLDQILTALRKLREGLVASQRRDHFAAQVFLFAARLGILASTHETYLPSLLYLLRVLHPPAASPGLLTRVEHAEVAGYLVLDAACRRGDLGEAFALRRRHCLADARVDGALRALAADDWVRWRRVCGAADGYKARLLAYAQPRVRAHALKAFGRAYLAVDRGFLERQAMASWEELRAQHGVGWEVRDAKIVIRKIQGRS